MAKTSLKNCTYPKLKADYTAKLASYKDVPSQQGRIERRARECIANKKRYVSIASQFGCPWELVAVIHYRESNFNFKTHLHNGDPLTAKTKRVPKGRPKFPPANGKSYTFEESAGDALAMKGFTADAPWDEDEYLLFRLEQYNGFGYRINGYGPSAYVWGGSTVYKGGKYVRDHVYDKNVYDQQLGTWPILAAIRRLDISDKQIVEESENLSIGKRIRQGMTGVGAAFAAFKIWALEFANDISAFFDAKTIGLMLATAAAVWFVTSFYESAAVNNYKKGSYTPSGLIKKRNKPPVAEDA